MTAEETLQSKAMDQVLDRSVAEVNAARSSFGNPPLNAEQTQFFKSAFLKGALWRAELAASAGKKQSLTQLPPNHEN